MVLGGGESVLECGSIFDPASVPIIELNDILHLTGGQRFGGACSDPTGSDGNVSVDPLFADAAPAAHGFALARPHR